MSYEAREAGRIYVIESFLKGRSKIDVISAEQNRVFRCNRTIGGSFVVRVERTGNPASKESLTVRIDENGDLLNLYVTSDGRNQVRFATEFGTPPDEHTETIVNQLFRQLEIGKAATPDLYEKPVAIGPSIDLRSREVDVIRNLQGDDPDGSGDKIDWGRQRGLS